MPITIQNQRSVPGYKESTNNLMVHCRNYFELRELAGQEITMVDRSGDSIDHQGISAIGKNVSANILMELNSATELLGDIEAAEQVLRGSIHPSIAQASQPCSLVAVAGSIVASGRSLDRLELDDPAQTLARETDRKAMIGELQEITAELKQTVADLTGLQMSLTASKFVGFTDCKTWSNAVSATTDFLVKKYRDRDVYHVPASKLT